MTETEKRYAQIEKEALALTWACEKFTDYLLGLHFLMETDHKPLVPLLGTKSLDKLPPRVLRFRLRMSRYNYSIEHVPGKYLYTADTLSSSHTTECPHLQRTDFSHARIVSLLVPTVSCLAILKDCILAPSDRLGLFFVLHGSR